MGLDSVELLMRVEEYFDISIPENDAGKIVTVQDFVDCVFSKVSVNPTEKCKSLILFYKLRYYLSDRCGIEKDRIRPDAKIRDVLTGDLKTYWTEMEKELKLRLPPLSGLDVDPNREKEQKILGFKIWTRSAPVTTGTIGDLVNWTLSVNFDDLIHRDSLFDKGDVERAVIGIISETQGISVQGIKLEHRITYDLGID